MKRPKNSLNINPILHQILEGELLGDGSLESRSSLSANFCYTTSNFEYGNYLMKLLESHDMKISNLRYPTYYSELTGEQASMRFRTINYGELKDYKNRWYNSDKIIPDDLQITPLILKHFYLGDGSCCNGSWSSSGRGKWLYRYKNIFLHTLNFNEDQNHQLSDKIFESSGIRFDVVNHHSTYKGKKLVYKQLRLPKPAKNNERFFNYLGECPVNSYEYKWNWQTEKKPK